MFADDDNKVYGISGNIYIKQEYIGSGAFGKVIHVQNYTTGERLVCKTEDITDKYNTLLYEAWVIQRFTKYVINQPVKCLQIKDVEYKQDKFSIIMESGGISLNKYIEKNGNFADYFYSLKNLYFMMIVKQSLMLLKYFHSAELVHRDIKPQNITVQADTFKVYLIDFGLVMRYHPKRMEYLTGTGFAGTIFFAPRAAHKRIMQVPRDDVESLCYTLTYISSSLPWRGIPIGDDKHDRFRQIKEEFVQSIANQTNIPEIVKLMLIELQQVNNRLLPFNYDFFINKCEQTINTIRQKIKDPYTH